MILTPILWESSIYLRGSFNRLWDKFIYLWTKSNPLTHNKTLSFSPRTRATHYTISLHFSFTAFTVLRKRLKISAQQNNVFLPPRRGPISLRWRQIFPLPSPTTHWMTSISLYRWRIEGKKHELYSVYARAREDLYPCIVWLIYQRNEVQEQDDAHFLVLSK